MEQDVEKDVYKEYKNKNVLQDYHSHRASPWMNRPSQSSGRCAVATTQSWRSTGYSTTVLISSQHQSSDVYTEIETSIQANIAKLYSLIELLPSKFSWHVIFVIIFVNQEHVYPRVSKERILTLDYLVHWGLW